ncbi:Uncharacterised protein [Legionella bozemanae]|uniref:Uncharacterized protein n=1 Tax=Legionella bozemanae TaxID=447 RepID=A0A0W0S1H7_LEGBO|nr:hypothetical protein Lboz_0169 [Legionella bozemanae]STO32829.1 Uncharacterised protein [Legionella bozemanae]
MSSASCTKVQSNEQDPKLNYKQKINVDVASGLIAGISNSGLFNPWDRASKSQTAICM